jgi:AcrR family transcriptional regulator
MELTGPFHSFMPTATAVSAAAAAAAPPLRRVRKRAQILEAASRIFATHVYHLVTMDQVAAAARVGKGTLYRYFPSKEDLYLAIVDEAFGLLIRRLETERGAAVAPEVALERMIGAIVQTFAEHLPSFRLIHRGEGRLFLRKKAVIRARRAHIARLLAEILDRGVETGVFRKVDRTLAPSMLIGMVWGTTLNHAEDSPAELLAPRLTDLCLHGLLQTPGRDR